jgi:hypothetical protein
VQQTREEAQQKVANERHILFRNELLEGGIDLPETPKSENETGSTYQPLYKSSDLLKYVYERWIKGNPNWQATLGMDNPITPPR